MAIDHTPDKSMLDALYCEEEQWEEESEITSNNINYNNNNLSLLRLPLFLLEQDLFWDDEELQTLFCKERETCLKPREEATTAFTSSSLSSARKEAVEWILKINARYGFSPLTAILAVNYLDRFLSSLQGFSNEKKQPPWMMQLCAATCLSLAAKVEETHVPLLLDLQVEGTKYVFEAKTIQRMEILVLSSLKWRMNPVTPLSFLDHIIRRLGLKSNLHWDFLRNSENLLLSFVSDPRFMLYMPSVLATATMLHVIRRVEPCSNAIVAYENQLLCVLKISKEEVDECYEVISEVLSNNNNNVNHLKRKSCRVHQESNNSNNNNSWGILLSSVDEESSSSSSCISSSSSNIIIPNKKMKRGAAINHQLPSLSRSVFVDAVVTPH
ncbi:hypothetical protein ACP275_02G037000 [Erythranthe tilingii]